MKKQYPDDFETFWKSYPTDHNHSKIEAFSCWEKLDAEDKADCVRSVPAFKSWLEKEWKRRPDFRPVHACRYIKYRRFEGFAEVAAKMSQVINSGVWVQYGTPEGDAWEAYLRGQGKIAPRDARGGWHFPTRLPMMAHEHN